MTTKQTKSLKISFETAVEDLILNYPAAVGFLTKHGVRCIHCGEPLWCSLGELFEQDKVENSQKLLNNLNKFIEEKYG
ncbi:MAG: DUF1858 domain-containing protein [bacterium]|nr:MAG: DUF1858 domain-containing protein [bacterium]